MQDEEQVDEELKSFIVRQSCEYYVVVEAEDEDGAIAQATAIPLDAWTGDWSPLDAEEN
jgi:hypothetical protein